MNRVALIGENSIEYINILLDIWNNGNCAVLLDYRIPSATAVEMMVEAQVKECYIERKYFERFQIIIGKSIRLSETMLKNICTITKKTSIGFFKKECYVKKRIVDMNILFISEPYMERLLFDYFTREHTHIYSIKA